MKSPCNTTSGAQSHRVGQRAGPIGRTSLGSASTIVAWPTSTACTAPTARVTRLSDGDEGPAHDRKRRAETIVSFEVEHQLLPVLTGPHGSPVWIAHEQVVSVLGDPRSDIFAIGVMLYKPATGELPSGSLTTDSEWLQQVVPRCLEHEAAHRYLSAAHLAFDLSYPSHVKVTGQAYARHGLQGASRALAQSGGPALPATDATSP